MREWTQGVGLPDLLSSQAFSAMLQPRIRAIRAVLAQLYPFLAQGAKHPICFDLADERIGAKGGGALLGVASPGLVSGGEIAGVEVE
jgi:hypothetical protein